MKKLKRSHLFAVMLVASFLLIAVANVPVLGLLGRVLFLFSTLAHEMGHGIATMLVGGRFESVAIQWDASGLTESYYTPGALRGAFISAGGLVGPSFAASLLFWSARGNDRRLRTMTAVLGIALLLAGILTARSIWALVFTLGLGPVLVWASRKVSRPKLEAGLVFIAVQLGLSVFTRADYLFTKWAGPGLPSDVAQMSNHLFLPFWFWGLLCGAISLAVLFWGFRCYTKES